MKKIFSILTAVLILAGFASCQKAESEDAFSTSPVAPELAAHNDILMTESTKGEDVVFTWSKYRNLAEGLNYELFMERNEVAVSIYNGPLTSYRSDKADFRSLVLSSFSDLPENDTFSLSFYVRVTSQGEVYQSNTISVNIYAYGDGVAPAVSLVAEETVLDPADPQAEVSLITWEPARLVYGEEVTYNVYVKVSGDESGNGVLLAEGLTGTSYSATVDVLNEAIVAAGGEEEAAVDVQFVVLAICESLPGGVEGTSQVMSITTYSTTFPDVLYLAGSHQAQAWDPASAPTIKQSGTIKGYYEGIVDLRSRDENTEFKFCIVPDWGGDFGGTVTVTEKDAYTQAEGTVGVSDNISVPSDRYVVMLNMKTKTIKMVTISSVGVIGTAVGGWENEITMDWDTETNVFTTQVDALTPGAFKFRLNNDWDWSIDDSNGVNGGGGDYTNSLEGSYKISLDMSSHPYKVKFINLEYPEKVYLRGSHNGWGTDVTISGNGEGVYQGFVNIGGEWGFKVTSGPGWASEGFTEWGLDSEGDTSEGGEITYNMAEGGGNIREATEVTFARVTVDLTNLTVKVLPINTVEICGSFTSWGVDENYFLTYNAESGSWSIENVEIPAGGQWKFRMNDDSNWTANLGYGTLDELVQDGDNITDTEPGVYTIELFISDTPYHAVLTKTGDSEAPKWGNRLVVAGDYSGHSWNGTDDPALMGDFSGKFQGPVTMYGMNDGFKFVHNGSWTGATATGEDGLSWTIVSGGGNNMTLPDGTWFFKVDMEAGTAEAIEVTQVGLTGEFNSWGDDVVMDFDRETHTYSGTITTTADGQAFKVRLNGSWDYSLGGDMNELTSLDGGNMTLGNAGTYTIVLDMASATPFLKVTAQ